MRLQLGEILFSARRYKEALAEAYAVLLADAKNRYGLELKGRALRELKDFDAASEAAEKALALDPRDLRTAFLKVTIAEARQAYTTAAEGLEAILARNRTGEDPGESVNNDGIFLARLGLAYQQLGRPADAAEAFRRAATVAGEPDAELIEYRVKALLQAKDLERALAEVRSARARFPKNVDIAFLEAMVLREKGETKAALEIVDKLKNARIGTSIRSRGYIHSLPNNSCIPIFPADANRIYPKSSKYFRASFLHHYSRLYIQD